MKYKCTLKVLIMGSLLILSACATDISGAGKKVVIVNVLTATDAERYSEIGPLSAYEQIEYSGDEESCLNDIRNHAAAEGADILVIESKKRSPCFLNKQQSCIEINGRAYRRKTKTQ